MKSAVVLGELGHFNTKNKDRCLVESLLSLSVKLRKVNCDIDCFEWNEIAYGWKNTAAYPRYIHVKGKPIITEERLPLILKQKRLNHLTESNPRSLNQREKILKPCNSRFHQYVVDTQKEKYGRNNFQTCNDVPVLKLSHTAKEASSESVQPIEVKDHEEETIMSKCFVDEDSAIKSSTYQEIDFSTSNESDNANSIRSDIQITFVNRQNSLPIEFSIIKPYLSSHTFKEKIHKLEGELKMDEKLKSELYVLQKIKHSTGKNASPKYNCKPKCYSSQSLSRKHYTDLKCPSHSHLMINCENNFFKPFLSRKSSACSTSNASSVSSPELTATNRSAGVSSALLSRRIKLNNSFDHTWFSNQSNVEIVGRKFKEN